MHPPFGDVVAALGKQLGADDAASLHFDPPSSLIGGEDLLARIYDAIRSSSSATGSNHLNTTLLVTFDEHGGTYDHVPPPPAVPPDGTGAPGQMGFTFNRSGVRIPTLAISAWIPEQTVVNDEFRATSLLATMRQRFNLGQPLSARDASARSFADIFTLTSPRAQEDWPTGHPTARPRDARIPRPPRRAARPARQVAPARRPSLRPGPRQNRPRHQAPKTRSPAHTPSPSATRPSATSSPQCATEPPLQSHASRHRAGARSARPLPLPPGCERLRKSSVRRPEWTRSSSARRDSPFSWRAGVLAVTRSWSGRD